MNPSAAEVPARVFLVSKVQEVFGKKAQWDEWGPFLLVHLDKPSLEVRRKRIAEFQPTMIFDPQCPHCQPFLEEGAYVVFTKEGPYGIRLLENGKYEMVGLTGK